jgi:DNA-binding winged helix-turn-helix (wHTH) protein
MAGDEKPSTDKWLTLEQALRTFGDPKDAEEMSRLWAYRGPQVIIVGAPESEYERKGRLYRAARERLIATVGGRLRAGHLVAMGRDPRSAAYLPPGIFPAEAWHRLKVAIEDLSVVDGDVVIRDVLVCLAEDAEASTAGPLPDPLQPAAPPRLIIYTEAHLADLDGRRVRLRNQDLKLLLLLAGRISSPPTYVSQREIEQHIWGDQTSKLTRAARDVVRELRKALAKGAEKPDAVKQLIKNEVGLGYRLALLASEVDIRD